ncbi:hypothetical protein P7C70_g4053, partial [Phenoliferia sp. Uapishka_3]
MASSTLHRFNSTKTPIPAPADLPTSPTETEFSRSSIQPALKSRFSDETLFVKTPRLASFSHHRWFSSPPGSPIPPTPPPKSGHHVSASEGGQRNNFEQDNMDEEVLDLPDDDERSTPIPIVKSVDQAIAYARKHDRSRSEAGAKGKDRQTPSSTPPASFLTPVQTTPPRPTRTVPSPPRTLSPSCIARGDLPPRSDSRNGFLPVGSLATLIAAQVQSKTLIPEFRTPMPSPPILDTPPLVLTPRAPRSPTPTPAPKTKLIPSPISTPTPNSTLTATPVVPSAPATSVPPFLPTLIRAPSTRSAQTDLNAIHVVLTIGNKSFTTTASTLQRNGRGGKLGEFVHSVIINSRREHTKSSTGGRNPDLLGASIYPPSDLIKDDGESLLSVRHFDHSPYPSPFPFSRYDSGDESPSSFDISDLDLDSTHITIPESPTSPIDPFARKMFFRAPPPPTLSIPPRGTKAERQGQLVSSPLPHLRVTSVHPSIYPTPSPRNLSPHKATMMRPYSNLDASDEGGADDSSDDEEDIEDRDWAPSLERSPFDNALSPFFKVLKEQSRTEVDGDGVELSFEGCQTSFLSMEKGSSVEHDLPPKPTLLGIPRATRGPRETTRIATSSRLPRLEVPRSEPGSRPPSLSMSLSSDDEAFRTFSESEESGMEIFLDRDGDLYGPIISYLRDGHLPADLALPPALPPNGASTSISRVPSIDPTTLSLFALHPPLVFNLLGSLRAVAAEATWLGIQDLVEACEAERDRMTEVVLWMEDRKRKEIVEDERKRRVEIMGARGKAGWI